VGVSPRVEEPPRVIGGRGVLPFLVSASSEGALGAQAARLRVYLEGAPEVGFDELARALAFDRARLPFRAVALAGDRAELVGLLSALERGEPAAGLVRGVAKRDGKLAFVFPGQGCQWDGMALELWESSPVFAAQMRACSEALEPYLECSLADVLRGQAGAPEDVLRGQAGAPTLERVDVLQPALFAVMVSLAALWRSFGVKPSVVVGHSQGEIAAAHVAGGLSLADATRIVALRGRALAQELAGRGGMVSIALPLEQVESHIGRFGERISLAAVNGPTAVVVSGEPEALTELLSQYEREDVRARRIPVDYASHSRQIEALRGRLADELSPIRPRTGEIPFYSTAIGAVLDTAELTADYWYTNLRHTVHFEAATLALLEDAFTTFVEVSPHPVLTMAVAETAEAQGADPDAVTATGSLRRGEGSFGRFLVSLAQVYADGVEVDWRVLFEGESGRRVELPTYAFQRKRYWLEMQAVDHGQLEPGRRAEHDALFELAWSRLQEQDSPSEGAPARVAVLGEGEHWGSPEETDVERYLDLAALREAVERGQPAPALVAFPARAILARGGSEAQAGDELASAIHTVTARTLELLQAWLACECLAGSRLVLLTESALAVADGEAPDLTQAALVGLLRSAHSEHPERFALCDVDRSEDPLRLLTGGLVAVESELALRQGAVYVPRLTRLEKARTAAHTREPLDPQGTVLITGGTGGLGAALARDLVSRHNARRLLLVSRSGLAAEGAQELRGELAELGCDVRIAACDVTRAEQLQELIAAIPADHPLTAVIHAAGVLDDGVIESLDGERLARVMAPKVDAAIHLHEWTARLGVSEFLCFSSAAATLGSPGQGNYAAANAFLDALVQHRRARGLPGISLAFGAWERATGMTGALSDADRGRLARLGIRPLADAHGLELIDLARTANLPLLLPMRIDAAALEAQARAGSLPALMRGLVSAPSPAAADAPGSLAGRLAGTPQAEWDAVVLEVVRGHVAAVLGHESPTAIHPRRPFKELGFDSLGAIELRNQLNQATGVKLPATLIFDHPTPAAVAQYLRHRVEGTEQRPQLPRRSAAQVDEPIAIVGMSCRYPGGVRSPAELWRLVASGTDAISGFPGDRGWDLERLYDPDPDRPGTSYARAGGFLYDAGEFDGDFFDISPREALAMDPQQRLLLEASWEVLEDAGVDPASLRGSQTGVFAGVAYHDYGAGVQLASQEFGELEGYLGIGSAGSVLSGRVAYTFGFEGPAVSVDTACSSSLVALHWACQSLRGGESSLALAGGVTVMSTPALFIEFSRLRGLSPDGRCKAFADAADGTAWSEGVGLLLLERLGDAERNGHRVLAVVKGSAVNQDGASNGLTAPNGPAQQRVIAQALANAGLSPEQVDAVEAHGTGTALGDPIEAQALLASYGHGRAEERPLWLGSIKSNIGHTQAASGVAGVIKMVMALQHGLLPQTLHADEPSSHVDWSAGAVSLVNRSLPWERNGEPRRAGVSSFGVSGTNAHVILEEAFDTQTVPDGARQADVLSWVISAKSDRALRAQAERLCAHVEAAPELDVLDVGFSLIGRAGLERRAVVVGEAREELLGGLGALARGEARGNVVVGAAGRDALHDGGLAFLFTGQGSQRAAMGRELYETFPRFAAALDETCAALDVHLESSLRDVLFDVNGSGEQLLDHTAFAQAGLFALEVALCELMQSFGVRPDFVMGHSIGELSAAHVAGVFSLEDACALVAARGRLMGALPEGGAMVSIQASERELAQTLAGCADRVTLAAVNGPRSVVLSGEEHGVLELADLWRGRGRKTKRLRVSHAFHSPLMEGMLDEFAALAERISFNEPRIPIISNVTGTVHSAEEVCTPEYWVRHVREPVRFAAGVRWLAQQGVSGFLELGPDGVLSAMVHDCLDEPQELDRIDEPQEHDCLDEPQELGLEGGGETHSGAAAAAPLAVPALRGQRAETEALLASLGELWVRGVAVDWAAAFSATRAKRVVLPTYAFQRKRHWLKTPTTGDGAASLGQVSAVHPLLGSVIAMGGGESVLFTGRISLQSHPWLADHVVLGTVVLPGTAFLELALHAGGEVGCRLVQEFALETPLVLDEHGSVQLQVAVGEPNEAGRRSIDIHSRPAGGSGDPAMAQEQWTRHASGVLSAGEPSTNGRPPVSQERAAAWVAEPWPPAGAESLEVDDLYGRWAEQGFEYGLAFQGLRAGWRRGDDIFAEISLSGEEQEQAGSFGVHPALLDGALHTVGINLLEHAGAGEGEERSPAVTGVRLPFAFGGVELYATGASSLRVCLSAAGDDAVSLVAVDDAGGLVLAIDSLVMRELPANRLRAAHDQRDSLFALRWSAVAALEPATVADHGSITVLGDASSELAQALHGGEDATAVQADFSTLSESLDGGGEAPGLVVADCALLAQAAHARAVAAAEGERTRIENRDLSQPELAHRTAQGVLDLLQGWLADERCSDSLLALVTKGAVAAHPEDQVPDLAGAPVWGLVRTAQLEHPERFVLVDVDGEHASWGVLREALTSGEPQLAVRRGEILQPRLARVAGVPPGVAVQERAGVPDFTGTVLITGATGALGAQLARHLADRHGAEHLLLVGRRGAAAEGALELQTELEALGAAVTFAACDVSDRERLKLLLDAIPADRPLRAVIHAAGVLDDGVIEALTAERLDAVLAAKVDAAWHLHELTEHAGLREFVLFSSAAATIGSPGQGNYAAANTFLDALAAHRHARGLAGIALAWGPWEQAGGMTGDLNEVDLARIGRTGMRTLSFAQGAELFDAALRIDGAFVLPAALDLPKLRGQAKREALPAVPSPLPAVLSPLPAVLSPLPAVLSPLPAVLSQLARAPARRVVHGRDAPLARRLSAATAAERERVVLELVLEQVAAVLNSAAKVDRRDTFKGAGFDSLTAVELRNRLNAATGLRLPATLVFDYPTPMAVAEYLLSELAGSRPRADASLAAPAANLAVPAALDEPVAIVGMSCRYPGGVRSPEDLWRLVAAGGEGISFFPTNRGWEVERLYDPDPDQRGTSYAREGGFLHDAGEFDAGFFGIGPREALAMDPQQRLLLEASWEAIEDAGIDPVSLRGSQTGVFAGLMYHDYGSHQGGAVPEVMVDYLGTGVSGSVFSGRVAYTFGLEGPAVTVDTACSSSLVALHLACQALRGGECELALAGGVTVMATPDVFVGFSRQRGLAADGRCKSFADTADGVGWGEGVGVVLVERLSDAQRRGHRVLGLVRGSAVNQDGASNGLTAPNGPSQQRVIARALASAGLAGAQVDAVEAHGTGTTLGDPIEAQALIATYGQGRPDGRPLWLGSVKSNIGHTQAAAGVAGVIKMVQALRHGVLPQTLHVERPSGQVDWSAGAVALLTEPVPWEPGDGPRRAGVSSFGISGTNAHVILEEAPRIDADADAGDGDGVTTGILGGGGGVVVVPWVLSGKGAGALRGQAERLGEFVGRSAGLGVGDVGLSLVGRSVFGHRAVVVGEGRDGLLEGLGVVAAGRPGLGVVEGVAGDVGRGVVFLFPGQGSQWVGMGRELLECSGVFARQLEACGEALEPFVGFSVVDVLRGGGELGRVDVVQPVLFAVMVSLAELWRACGVRPDVVVGHSQGEIAAACVAGGLSLEDAARVVGLRSKVLLGLAGRGGMVSIAADVGVVEGLLEGFGGRVGVAAVNGPGSVVVSGDADALREFVEMCETDGVRAREIPVDYASHSAHVEEVREELLDVCAGIVPRSGDVPFHSTVTGGLLDTRELDAEYWYRSLRETVRFGEVVGKLLGEGYRAFVEVSPHPVLTVGVQESVDEVFPDRDGVVAAGSLRRGEGGPGRFVMSLAELWVRGVDVDWGRLFEGSGAARVALPSYAFQRERFWLAGAAGEGDVAAVGQVAADHPLLGAAVALAGERGWVFTGRISLELHPWLEDHAVLGVPVLPGTILLELALYAGAQLGCGQVRELVIEAPLVLPAEGAVQLQLHVGEPDESGGRPLGIYSRLEHPAADLLDSADGEWLHHAGGMLTAAGDGMLTAAGDVTVDRPGRPALGERMTLLAGAAWPPVGAEAVDVDELYAGLAERGFEYGPAFQGLRAVWRAGEEVFAEVSLADEELDDVGAFGIHPALFDAALHTMAVELRGEGGATGTVRLPFAFEGVELYASGGSRLRICLFGADRGAVGLVVADGAGKPVGVVNSLVTRELPAAQFGAVDGVGRDSLFTLDWVAVPAHTATQAAPRLAVLGGEGAVLAQSSDAVGRSLAVYAELDALSEAIERGAAAPSVVLVDCAATGQAVGESGGFDGLDAAHRTTHRVLGLVQRWLLDERFAGARLALVTRNAVAVSPGDGAGGLAQSPTWGLLRSAQSEHPERFVLVDVDGSESLDVLVGALDTREPQLAVREGKVLIPRLTRATGPRGAGPFGLSGRGTVLITGGTGTLGGLLARHLVAAHGVDHLLLASRKGGAAEGATELQTALADAGASVTVAACDVTDRAQLQLLLDSIPAEYPLSAVIHAAGTLDDGVIGSLTAARLDGVLLPKADAAWHLHELTAQIDLDAFVLFSSAAGTLGSPGQGNYAAANAFLDSLSAYRRARGLAGVAMAWGLWEQTSAITGGVREADRLRMGRSGLSALASESALELFDKALALDEPFVVTAPLDLGHLRAQARAGSLAALLRGLVRVPARRSDREGASLAQRVVALAEDERESLVLEAVRTEIATVLGYASPGAVGKEQTFKALGVDSLSAVELRNRLSAATDLRLPATLVFDYPTPLATAGYLLERMSLDGSGGERDQDEAEIRRAIASVPLTRLRSSGLLSMLLELADADEHAPVQAEHGAARLLEEMDAEGLVERALAVSEPGADQSGRAPDGG
jgi:acyl transferase domain-containing protein/acyl carrier protein